MRDIIIANIIVITIGHHLLESQSELPGHGWVGYLEDDPFSASRIHPIAVKVLQSKVVDKPALQPAAALLAWLQRQ